jgi:GR25 family glycosyltransferase involved in LPS biosynthesis
MTFNTYVINLDSQKKRYEVQEKKLNEVGIYPTRISGYKFENIGKSEIKKHFSFIFTVDSFASRSAIGCTYSHIQTLKHFLDNDPYDVALIMEDDAFPLFTNIVHLEKKLENIDWDYLSLHCDGVCPKDGGKSGLLSGSTAAYFITREGAKKIINYKHSFHYDVQTTTMKNLDKKIDDKNSFWTDENAKMSGESSTNRYKRYCHKVYDKITDKVVNRGEKTACHYKDYRMFRIPVLGYETSVEDLIIFLLFILISCTAFIGVKRIKSSKK